MSELILREKKQFLNKKKKKGFTLVELIAVIAILAILGAIIVPKVTGYTDKADKAKVQADAKTVLTAVQAYNADKGTDEQIIGIGSDGKGVVGSAAVDAAGTVDLTSQVTVPSHLYGLTVTQLETVASGSGTGYKITKSASTYKVTFDK